MYNTINKALHSANQQIRATKAALGLADAPGLVILENLVPTDISVLSLIDAADRKMMNGLDEVDATLCVDFVNTFVDQQSAPVRPAQILVMETEKSSKRHGMVGEMLLAFCGSNNTPLLQDFEISKADQI